MTNPDFAELKEKLTSFDSNKTPESLPVQHRFDWILNQEKQLEKPAAIITELLEIIQSQSELLKNTHKYLIANRPLGPKGEYAELRLAVMFDLSEINTRLQKLRDGKI